MATSVGVVGTMEEPHATNKHTICGYAWSDVTTALVRAIANADMVRALRWSAELVCSEQGLGRLEAALLHAWALHVGFALPSWPKTWFIHIHQIRSLWEKAHGDTKAIRNTPLIRQLVAEATASLVLAAKKPLPALPTSADCFREAEAMRSRIRVGGGIGDQIATRRVWSAGADGADLRTICNEMEAALRSNQISRLLFWIVWIITLDKQEDAPMVHERGPSHLSAKQRKSIVWFLIAVLREIANEGAFLSVEDRNGLFGSIELCWVKLGEKGRRDTIASVALCIQEHLQKRTSLQISNHIVPPSIDAIRNAISTIDTIYAGIAEEARKYLLEVPRMVGLTSDEHSKIENKKHKLNSIDKMNLVYTFM